MIELVFQNDFVLNFQLKFQSKKNNNQRKKKKF